MEPLLAHLLFTLTVETESETALTLTKLAVVASDGSSSSIESCSKQQQEHWIVSHLVKQAVAGGSLTFTIELL